MKSKFDKKTYQKVYMKKYRQENKDKIKKRMDAYLRRPEVRERMKLKQAMRRTCIPFFPKFVDKIRKGTKTTTIRTYNHTFVVGKDYFVRNRKSGLKVKILTIKPIDIPKGITKEIARSEGFESKEEMLRFFHRYKLPAVMKILNFKVV